MADTPVSTAAAPASKGSTFGFLGHKIAGKVPVWVVALAAVGGYYAYTHYGPGKKTKTAAQQTDPAGNVGTIDPATGFVYGSPEDLAAIAGGSTSGTDTTGAAAGGTLGDTGTGGSTSGTDTSGGGSSGGGSTGDTGTYVPPASTGSTATTSGTTSAAAPPVTVRTPPGKAAPVRQRTVTVTRGQTLAQIAAANGVSVASLAHANTYVPGELAGNAKVGQPLGTGAGLKTGQVLVIPNK